MAVVLVVNPGGVGQRQIEDGDRLVRARRDLGDRAARL